MATARKTAAKKPAGTTALVKWDEALAARAAKAKKTEANVGGGDWLSCKGATLTYQGNAVPGNALDVVIVSGVMENQLYDGKYDPNNPSSPVCYAFGEDEDSMVPHEKSESPQAASCAECEHNQWGSGEGGSGKACKNVRRLGVIPADALENGGQGVKEAPIAWFKVPVTSVKGYASFVKQLAATNLPPLAFVSEISVAPDAKTQLKVSFNAKEQIQDGEVIGALLDKAEVVDEQIVFPYEVNQAKPAKPAARGRGAAPSRSAPAAKKAAPAATKPAIKKAAGRKF
jgi:hypothetical protein